MKESDLMNEQEKLQMYIDTLIELTNLTREELDEMDDTISDYIPNCISNTVIIMGNKFDEYLSILIKESKSLLNELYVKKVNVVDIPDILRRENINKSITNNIGHILGKDIFEFDSIYTSIVVSLSEYYKKEFTFRPHTTLSVYEKIIKPIEEDIDRIYLLSKQFSEWCISKVKYNYAYNTKMSLEEICIFVIDGIVYLYKYYITLFKVYEMTINALNEALFATINR